MGEFLEPDDLMPDFVPARADVLPDPSAGDIFGASMEAMRATDLTSSEAENQGRAFGEIWDGMLQSFDGDAAAMSEALQAQQPPALAGLDAEQRARLSVGMAYDLAQLERIRAYRNSLPPEQRETIPDPDRLEARAREIALQRYTEAEAVMSQARGFGEGAAKFGGGMAGAMTDPVNIAAMMIFKRPLTTFRGAVAYGAVTSGATELVLQPVVQDYRAEVGLPAGWDIGFQNVLYATLGGAVFGAGEGGLIKLGQALDARTRQGVATNVDLQVKEIVDRYAAGNLDAEGVKEEFAALAQRDPAFAAAIEISERTAAAEAALEENPFGLSPEAMEAHNARQIAGLADLAPEIDPELRPEDVAPADLPPAPAVAGAEIPQAWQDMGLEIVDYGSLARDPDRFQFKESDQDGVTDALRDVEAWEPERAGVLLVWEATDGTRYVANGHQRHALADRLTSAGADPISGPAFILRENEGVTAEAAMVRGALINIAEGSGTSLDAARILRADADAGATLPPRSPLVKEAKGISRLSDEAFGLVVNEKISPRWGALVGARVEDPALQSQIGLALQGVDPRTLTEAESIIQDLLTVPVVEGRTADLFGEADFKQALIAERAKAKAAALRLLSRDKRTFGTLTKEFQNIEAEGNRLDPAANREVEQQAARLKERIEREAHVKGEISDALSDAARSISEGEPVEAAARRLVQSLTGRAEGGGQRRSADAGGDGADPAEGATAGRRGANRLGTGLADLLKRQGDGTERVIAAYADAEDFGQSAFDLITKGKAPDASPAAANRLASAAVKWRGKVYKGKNHGDAVRAAEAASGETIAGISGGQGEAVAGFVDARGKFLSRTDAALSALASGQVTDPAVRRVIEARIKRGEDVPLTTEHVDFSAEGGRFTKASSLGHPGWDAARRAGIDLSPQARLKRAGEMGFNTDEMLFHGTSREFEAFDANAAKVSSSDQESGIFFTPRALTADQFARYASSEEGGSGKEIVMPVFVRGTLRTVTKDEYYNNLKKLGWSDEDMRDGMLYEPLLFAKVINEAKALDYDGVRFVGVKETRFGFPADQVVIFDPKNIRSINAVFNPKFDGSADILAAKSSTTHLAPSELARMDTLFVKDDAAQISRALAEAAACAGGVPMAGMGQMVAGSAVGLGVGLGLAGMAMTYGTEQQRDDRWEEWFQTDPDMEFEREVRAEYEQLKAERVEQRAAALWRVQLQRATGEAFREDIGRLPAYMSQMQYNTWAERFTGVAAAFLDDMIGHESDGDWQAKAPTSSATGGAQFIASTWRKMMKEYGPQYGLTLDPYSADADERQRVLELRTDPRWGTVMAALFAKDNAIWLQSRLGRPATQKDAYLAHFLGRDAALKMLKAAPDAKAPDLFPTEAKANPNVFYHGGNMTRPRSVKEVIARQTSGFSGDPLFIHPDVAEGRT